MAISFVGSATGTNSATLPTHQAGDLILAFAFRNANATVPALPEGFTLNRSLGFSTRSWILAYRFASASGTTSGTWTNADGVVFNIYRNVYNIGYAASWNDATSPIDYRMSASVSEDNSSWAVSFAGHRGTSVVGLGTAPTGMTNRGYRQSGVTVASHDSNGPIKYSTGWWTGDTVAVTNPDFWSTAGVLLYGHTFEHLIRWGPGFHTIRAGGGSHTHLQGPGYIHKIGLETSESLVINYEGGLAQAGRTIRNQTMILPMSFWDIRGTTSVLGYKFTVKSNPVVINALGMWTAQRAVTDGTSENLRLWRVSDEEILAEVDLVSDRIGPNYVKLNSAITLEANTTYVISGYYDGVTRRLYRSGSASTHTVNTDIITFDAFVFATSPATPEHIFPATNAASQWSTYLVAQLIAPETIPGDKIDSGIVSSSGWNTVSSNWQFGYEFTVNQRLTFNTLKCMAHTNGNVELVRLWRKDDATLLASTEITGVADEWVSKKFGNTINLHPGEDYIIAGIEASLAVNTIKRSATSIEYHPGVNYITSRVQSSSDPGMPLGTSGSTTSVAVDFGYE